jgi:xanthine dehydrogenase accessory factor
MEQALLAIGLGPGFQAGLDCHAVIETNRGPALGRVIWQGGAQDDTGIPERVGAYRSERVLRAPAAGVLDAVAEIGALLAEGDLVARVGVAEVRAPFHGVLRGLLHPGLEVRTGEKIGDLDPRGDPALCWLVSDKALAVGGGVLEAILSRPALRPLLWETPS